MFFQTLNAVTSTTLPGADADLSSLSHRLLGLKGVALQKCPLFFRLKMRAQRVTTVILAVSVLATLGYIVRLHRRSWSPVPGGDGGVLEMDREEAPMSADQSQTSDHWPVL